MSAALPTGRRGQVFAVGGLVVVAAMVWLGMIAPLLGWYAGQAEAIVQQRVLAEHLAALVEQLPALQAQAATAAGHNRNIEDVTDARAGADLQQKLEAMAVKTGAHIASIEFLQPESVGGYRRIELRIHLTDHYPVLIALLAAIEQAAPQLFIDDLHLRATGSEGDPTPSAELTFVVVMLRANPAPASLAPA